MRDCMTPDLFGDLSPAVKAPPAGARPAAPQSSAVPRARPADDLLRRAYRLCRDLGRTRDEREKGRIVHEWAQALSCRGEMVAARRGRGVGGP